MGCDLCMPVVRAMPMVSIHAPAWGATERPDNEGAWGKVSIHAPAWGATRFAGLVGQHNRVSIHAPAWGATAQNA